MKKLLLIAVAALAATLAGSGLYADNFPSRAVTFTAVFGPGSASDTICRIIADPLGRALKQPVIVDGRNLYDVEKMRELGVRYHSIGRPSA